MTSETCGRPARSPVRRVSEPTSVCAMEPEPNTGPGRRPPPRPALRLPVRLDQDLRDLRPRELLRRQLALGEELAHLRPREEDAVVGAVRARLRRRHLAARPAPERVLEEHRLDPELVRLELVEDELRVVRAVVRPDARVVAPDDEVRAAPVLAADRVPDRL